jgi:hypothetical protein
MATYRRKFGTLLVVAMSACAHPQEPGSATAVTSSSPGSPAPGNPAKLVALPVESIAFPKAARATNDSLLHAQVDGLGVARVSKVSLEVVQLAIECVEPSTTCYAAVGRSLAASGLLFAQIAAVKRRQLKVTITLFDVDARAPRTRAEKVFASENEATAGIAALVAEVTRP